MSRRDGRAVTTQGIGRRTSAARKAQAREIRAMPVPLPDVSKRELRQELADAMRRTAEYQQAKHIA